MQNEIRGNTCFLIVLIFERWIYLWKKLVYAFAGFSQYPQVFISVSRLHQLPVCFFPEGRFPLPKLIFPSCRFSIIFFFFPSIQQDALPSLLFFFFLSSSLFPMLQNAFALFKNGYDKLINDGKEILPRQATAAIFSQKFQLDCVLMGIGISFFTRSI